MKTATNFIATPRHPTTKVIDFLPTPIGSELEMTVTSLENGDLILITGAPVVDNDPDPV